MANKSPGPAEGPVLATVEQWQREKNIIAAAHKGAMIRAGWSAGQRVAEAEYDAALSGYLRAPAGGGGTHAQ